MASKRKHEDAPAAEDADPIDPSEEFMFLALGGGNEVGRSCHIIKYKGKTVMLDAGIHPAYDGLAALPFYDEYDLSTVDILLITHFHVDHVASLPYVLAKTNFKGKIYMTSPTKQIAQWMLKDAVRIQNMHTTSEFSSQLYDEKDILNTWPLINTVTFNRTYTHSAIRLTPYPAGHVLGAAMFLIEIAGLKILFTGDYSRELDRHLIPAAVPKGVKVDVLITESTFGVSSFSPRQERETALMKSMTTILNRGGRCLMPVSSTGHVQELLLILEEYWERHPEFHKYPVYYASGLAKRCMQVYQTSLDSMNDNIKAKFERSLAQAATGDGRSAAGPWDFQYIRSLKSLERFDDVGGCVMLASPSMLQNGVSRALLEQWAPDPKNGVIVTGYSVEGTMTKQLLEEPLTIPAVTSKGRGGAVVQGMQSMPTDRPEIPRRCTIQEHNFALHVDGTQNREFIEEVAAPVVILVHGSKTMMMRLKSKLLSLNAHKTIPTKVYSPANCEEVRIPFRRDKFAQVVGRLANEIQPPQLESDEAAATAGNENGHANKVAKTGMTTTTMSGVLVQKDFKLSLMAPADLKEYAGLATTTVLCKQRLTLSAAGTELIRWALEGTFGSIDDLTTDVKSETADEAAREAVFRVMGAVTVKVRAGGDVRVEWEGNLQNDGIADAVLAVLFTVETSPAAVKESSRQSNHDHGHGHGRGHGHDAKPRRNLHANMQPEERLSRICMFLESHFGIDAVRPIATPKPRVTPNGNTSGSSSDEVKAEKHANGEAVADAGTDADAEEQTASGEVAGYTETERAQEMERLYELGIPVPGLEIRADKNVALVWLETLEVECPSRVFADRVRAVVDRAAEVVAPLWV